MLKEKKNFLKEKIIAGKPVIGTWNTLSSPLVTEVLARSGYDFIIIDFEHGPFDISNINLYINACESYNCSPIIRIPKNETWMSLQALDQGAHGVMVPGIDSYRTASDFISSIKYFPKGKRGYTPFSKAGGFTNRNNNDHSLNSNNFTLSSIIIESIDGINNIDEILKIKDLEIIYFGAYDLSQDLGCPGDIKNDKVISIIKSAVKKVNSVGKIAGGFVPQSKEDINWLLKIGIKFITYNVDSDIIFSNSNKITEWFKQEI